MCYSVAALIELTKNGRESVFTMAKKLDFGIFKVKGWRRLKQKNFPTMINLKILYLLRGDSRYTLLHIYPKKVTAKMVSIIDFT